MDGARVPGVRYTYVEGRMEEESNESPETPRKGERIDTVKVKEGARV